MQRIRSASWTVQPQEAVDLRSFSAPWLLAYLPPAGEANLVTKSLAAQTSGVSRVINPGGVFFSGGKSEHSQQYNLQNGLTIVSVWKAGSPYVIADGSRVLLSNRTAGNAGFSWGRSSAITGNITRQEFVIQGVAAYVQSTWTIESEIETPVAVRYSKARGQVEFWQFGEQVNSRAATTSPTNGGSLVVGAQGPYSTGALPWINEAAVVLAFAGELSDAELRALTAHATAPYFAFESRRIWVPQAAASGLPTLGTVSATDITASGFRPSVTYTY